MRGSSEETFHLPAGFFTRVVQPCHGFRPGLEQGEVGQLAREGGHLVMRRVLLAQLAALVYGVEGVENYAFTQPGADIAGVEKVLLTPGELTITEMGG